MRYWSILFGVIAVLAAAPAQAQTAGAWRVDGAISGRTFQLDCRFEGAGGVCVDASSGGKQSHRLSSLSSSGDQVAWSFTTKVMLMSIAMNFAGRISGNHMSGTARAAGRTGTFTAVRR